MLSSKSKILVVGTSGSGKSTLARELSHKLGSVDIELDALHWKENWTPADPSEFREEIVRETSNREGFIIHGNYNKVRDLTWGQADTVLWLDYPKSLVIWRVLKRSVVRVLTREKLWAGNQETLRKTFFSKESIILWAWQTHALRKKQYLELAAKPEYQNVTIHRFDNPKQAALFVESLSNPL
jgi:adenylate kinase family enzyme